MTTSEETRIGLGPLDVLQLQRIEPGPGRLPSEQERDDEAAVRTAAADVAYYQDPSQDEMFAHQALSRALTEFLVAIARHSPPSQERSTAIARAREAKFWSSAAIAMQRPPIKEGE